MKKIILAIVIAGSVFFVVPNDNIYKVSIIKFFDQLIGKKSRFEKVAYKDSNVAPWLQESRAKAAGYQPILIPGYGTYAVPTAHAAVILDALS